MYSKLQLLQKYLKYTLSASNGKGHGVHSPFVFDFIIHVLNDKKRYETYQQIEAIRKDLLTDETLLTIQDFGAGSRVDGNLQRKVSSIAASALKPKKYAQLMFRMINYYHPKNILELGTSLGITTSYLGSAGNNTSVVTMEGSPAVAGVAQNNFNKLGLKNIQLIEGNFDETLASTLQQINTVDFAFIDGNHRKEPTIQYFNQLLSKTKEHSVLIFDDVHWSEEMEQAWEIIKQHEAVTLSIDLFFIGIVFFRNEQKTKQHFTIRF
jgi:predicted O-methyltransferase YrrM